MTDGCTYRTKRELLSAAREIDSGKASPISLRDGFYKEVRMPLDRPESHLVVRLFLSNPPLYLLEERGRYFFLGRMGELIERYPNLGRLRATDDKKLRRLDLLPITHEEAVEKALKYDTAKTREEKRESA